MENKNTIGIKVRLLIMSLLPIIILGIVLSLLASNAIEEAVNDEVIRNLNSVSYSCEHMFEDFVDITDPENKSRLQDYCEYVKEMTQVELTIFLGDTRYATSVRDENGNLMVGTKASDFVIDTVMNKKEEYSSRDVEIGGEKYFAFYIPTLDSTGTVTGMVFAGQPLAYVAEIVSKAKSTMVMISSIIFVIVIITSILVSRRLGQTITEAVKYVTILSEGKLDFAISEKICARGDELGQLGRGIKNVRNVLKEIVGGIISHADELNKNSAELHDMSGSFETNSGQIASTVDELSRSIVSLSENVQNCVNETSLIGEDIDDISENISDLRMSMEEVRKTSDETKATITELSNANISSVEAVSHIAEQVNATSSAVANITGITDTLTDITSQINLLSLNASIEAARAGEAGRGFAVVADEIRKLADQSSSSTEDIINIITNLTAESEKTLNITSEVKKAILTEKESLDKASSSFGVIQNGIDNIGKAVDLVNDKTKQLDIEKTSVVENVTDLSSISEQNAASVEEASAGCEELSATSSMLRENADAVNKLAMEIREKLDFFC